MKSQKYVIKQSLFSSLLLLIIFLSGGCDSVQKESLEKNKIPEVRNITEVNVNTETQSEIISEATVAPTTVSPTEVLTEQNIELTTETLTQETPYVRPFDTYIRQNDDFMGWIKIDGTSIDDPIVQGDDNAHYLNYDYTGAKNYAGAIFLDYKNQGNFYDNHMSLYAHYMENGTMFHDLHKYKDKDFLTTYPDITISGLRETKTYEIFSVHIVSAYDYYLYLDLSDDALVEYAAHFQRLSMHDTSVTFPADLKLLTLVTCTYEFDNARLLIHAYQK